MMIDQQLKGKVMVITGANHLENHPSKLSMGFAVEPMECDEKCLAFVMPLKPT
jgi:hypothetical protein